MEKRNKKYNKPDVPEMAIECPFCSSIILFNDSSHGENQFKRHIQKEHLSELVNYIMRCNKKEVSKSSMRWCINP